MVRIHPFDTVARLRAHLMHILYEINHDDHQFRLRFNGVYLRDADNVEDYEIMENAIIKMIPLARSSGTEVIFHTYIYTVVLFIIENWPLHDVIL